MHKKTLTSDSNASDAEILELKQELLDKCLEENTQRVSRRCYLCSLRSDLAKMGNGFMV